MARRATRQQIRALNVVPGRKSVAAGKLIRRRQPFHIKDLALWPQVLFRRAMTSDAPLHLQRSYLPRQRHFVNAAVTSRATDSLIHVNTMIEVNKVWEIMNAGPPNWPVCAKALADRLQVWAICKELRMAIHTRLRRRDASECRGFHRRMAIAAIDASIACMMLVAELNGLFPRNKGARVV